RYSGKECDDFTSLYYYGYRYYAPWMGRWLSPDPVGPKDDLNLYQFVLGDPVNLIDPDGLESAPQKRPGVVTVMHVRSYSSDIPQERAQKVAVGNVLFQHPESGQWIEMTPAEARRFAAERGVDISLQILDRSVDERDLEKLSRDFKELLRAHAGAPS